MRFAAGAMQAAPGQAIHAAVSERFCSRLQTPPPSRALAGVPQSVQDAGGAFGRAHGKSHVISPLSLIRPPHAARRTPSPRVMRLDKGRVETCAGEASNRESE